jgi:methylenetetrahydrofolate dehydrogenase (NAD+)
VVAAAQHDVVTLRRYNMHLPITMMRNKRISSFFVHITAPSNCKLFSTTTSNINSKDGDDDEDEPEYLEIVTQTADRMRIAVRKYVDEYARSFDCKQTESDELSKPPQIKLVGILATNNTHPITQEDCSRSHEDDNHANELYSEQIANICSVDGIAYEPWRVPPTQASIERAIQHANERLDVHGILVFYPIENLSGNTKGERPDKWESTGVYYKSMDDYFRDMVSPEKDVEGHRRNKGLRMRKVEEADDVALTTPEVLGPIYPCTALAVFRIIESFQLNSIRDVKSDFQGDRLFEGRTMTIINRSEVLGMPLAILLSKQGAKVYSIDKDSILTFLPGGGVGERREHSTTTMEQCVLKSSVVVTGVPSRTFRVPTACIRDNATLINVATDSNFEEEEVAELSGVTYVPHVGRVTVAALEFNLCLLHQNYHRDKN